MASAEGSSKPVAADALVFFGATGDLAYKKIFPSLQGMIRRGDLTVPIIGVAKSGWGIEQLRERARKSLEEYGGGVDEATFAKLVGLLQSSTATTPTRRRSPRCARRSARPRTRRTTSPFRRASSAP